MKLSQSMALARLALAPLALATSLAVASPWPEVTPPPRAKVEWVARDLRVNGLPSRIQHFESELSAGEVLQFYRERWAKGSLPPREVAAAGWDSVATVQDRYQMVVQVRARVPQGSEGMLSAADLSDVKADYLPADWPSWSNVTVTQVTESVDGAKRSHVVSMVSNDGFDLNVRRLRDEWMRRGYYLTQQHTNAKSPSLRSWIGLFNKQDRSLDLLVAYNEADRRTYITANLVTAVAPGSINP